MGAHLFFLAGLRGMPLLGGGVAPFMPGLMLPADQIQTIPPVVLLTQDNSRFYANDLAPWEM